MTKQMERVRGHRVAESTCGIGQLLAKASNSDGQKWTKELLIKCGAGALAREKPAYLDWCLLLGDPCSEVP